MTEDNRMARSATTMLTAGALCLALGCALAACGKKDDPRAAGGVDRYPAGYPAGAPSGPVDIFRKTETE